LTEPALHLPRKKEDGSLSSAPSDEKKNLVASPLTRWVFSFRPSLSLPPSSHERQTASLRPGIRRAVCRLVRELPLPSWDLNPELASTCASPDDRSKASSRHVPATVQPLSRSRFCNVHCSLQGQRRIPISEHAENYGRACQADTPSLFVVPKERSCQLAGIESRENGEGCDEAWIVPTNVMHGRRSRNANRSPAGNPPRRISPAPEKLIAAAGFTSPSGNINTGH